MYYESNVSNNYSIYLINRYLIDLGPLTKSNFEQEKNLLSKAKNGDSNSLRELILSNQYIVIKEALRFSGCGIELLDLLQYCDNMLNRELVN